MIFSRICYLASILILSSTNWIATSRAGVNDIVDPTLTTDNKQASPGVNFCDELLKEGRTISIISFKGEEDDHPENFSIAYSLWLSDSSLPGFIWGATLENSIEKTRAELLKNAYYSRFYQGKIESLGAISILGLSQDELAELESYLHRHTSCGHSFGFTFSREGELVISRDEQTNRMITSDTTLREVLLKIIKRNRYRSLPN